MRTVDRTYDTPHGYEYAIRQLTRMGYNYFLVTKTRRRSKLVAVKYPEIPRKQRTYH